MDETAPKKPGFLGRVPWGRFFFELLIVFIGVYLAFLLGSYQEDQRLEKEQQKVLSSLKLELERFRIQLPGFAAYHENEIRGWKKIQAEGRVVDFYLYRFVQPQYEYEVLEYAIDKEGSSVVDFDLFNALRACLAEIRRLEYAEEKMTGLALEYHPPGGKGIPPYLEERNLFLFNRFIVFAQGRAAILREVAFHAEEALEIINARLSEDTRIALERELVEEYLAKLDKLPSSEEIKGMIAEYFPGLPEGTTRDILAGLEQPEN